MDHITTEDHFDFDAHYIRGRLIAIESMITIMGYVYGSEKDDVKSIIAGVVEGIKELESEENTEFNNLYVNGNIDAYNHVMQLINDYEEKIKSKLVTEESANTNDLPQRDTPS